MEVGEGGVAEGHGGDGPLFGTQTLVAGYLFGWFWHSGEVNGVSISSVKPQAVRPAAEFTLNVQRILSKLEGKYNICLQ